MQISKLSEILSYFETRDWNKFGEFVNSPYFNSSEKVIKTYQFIFDNKSRFCEFDTRNLIKNVFDNKVTASEFHQIKTQLINLLHLYLYFENKNEFAVNEYLFHLNFFTVAKAPKNKTHIFKSLENTLKENPISDQTYLLKFELEYDKVSSNLDKLMYSDKDNFQSAVRNLDEYFILKKTESISVHA